MSALLLTRDDISAITKARPVPRDNMDNFLIGMDEHAARYKLDPPHRLAQFMAQVMHETAGLKYDREIWGPTATQKRYEGRKDLGNTQAGDGSKFRGYGFIQVTGRANTTAFRDWARKEGLEPPDFCERPEHMATAPWSTTSAIWFWHTRDLNQFADRGDIEMITRRVNGGLNGYPDRLDYFTRSALVLLGYKVDGVRDFQRDAKLAVDGTVGPRTRDAMHAALMAMAREQA